MSGDPEHGVWEITVDRREIVEWAEEQGVVPVRAAESDGGHKLRLLTDPEDARGKQVSWDKFFDRFEEEWLALRYRDTSGTEDTQPAYEFVDREEMSTGETEDVTESDFDQATTHQNAWSDTGDDEPMPAETEASGDSDVRGETAARDNTEVSGTRVSQDDAANQEEDTTISESSHSVETGALVLDEIHEERGLTDDVEDEYLQFENTADTQLDLSGWVVENEDGQQYVFPDGTVLDSGGYVTLHSGNGSDSGTDLYWGAIESVWDDDGDTVTVKTADGQQILREPFMK